MAQNLNLKYNVTEGKQKVRIDGSNVPGTEEPEGTLRYLLGVGYTNTEGNGEAREEPKPKLIEIDLDGSKRIVTSDMLVQGDNVSISKDVNGNLVFDAKPEEFNIYDVDGMVDGVKTVTLNNTTSAQELFTITKHNYVVKPGQDPVEQPEKGGTQTLKIKLPEISNLKYYSQLSQSGKKVTLSNFSSAGQITDGGGSITFVNGTNINVTSSGSKDSEFTIDHSAITTTNSSVSASSGKALKGVTLSINNGHVTNVTKSEVDLYSNTVGTHYLPSRDSTADISTTGSNSYISKVTIQRDSKGHVTGIDADTIGGYNLVKQSSTTSSSNFPILCTANTNNNVDVTTYFNSNVYIKPSTGGIYASSDRSLKENITEVNTPENILDVPIVEFDWKDTKSHSVGVIAQDLEKVAPVAVSTSDSGLKSVNYTTFLLLRIAALEKELKEIKDKLK